MDSAAHEMFWVDDLSVIPVLPLAEGTFCALLACDAIGVSAVAISTALESLLDRGMVYLCAWGPDCERVHDIADEIIVGDGTSDEPDSALIMTTWHDDEALEDAAWFAVNSAMPSEDFSESFRGVIAISVGDEAWADVLADALDVRKQRVEYLATYERLVTDSGVSDGLDGSGMPIEEAQALANRTGQIVDVPHLGRDSD